MIELYITYNLGVIGIIVNNVNPIKFIITLKVASIFSKIA